MPPSSQSSLWLRRAHIFRPESSDGTIQTKFSVLWWRRQRAQSETFLHWIEVRPWCEKVFSFRNLTAVPFVELGGLVVFNAVYSFAAFQGQSKTSTKPIHSNPVSSWKRWSANHSVVRERRKNVSTDAGHGNHRESARKSQFKKNCRDDCEPSRLLLSNWFTELRAIALAPKKNMLKSETRHPSTKLPVFRAAESVRQKIKSTWEDSRWKRWPGTWAPTIHTTVYLFQELPSQATISWKAPDKFHAGLQTKIG